MRLSIDNVQVCLFITTFRVDIYWPLINKKWVSNKKIIIISRYITKHLLPLRHQKLVWRKLKAQLLEHILYKNI